MICGEKKGYEFSVQSTPPPLRFWVIFSQHFPLLKIFKGLLRDFFLLQNQNRYFSYCSNISIWGHIYWPLQLSVNQYFTTQKLKTAEKALKNIENRLTGEH